MNPTPKKPKPRPPLERTVEKAVCDYATKRGWLVLKFTPAGQRGWPDRILLHHGEAMFIEFKQLDKKPTKLQKQRMGALHAEGFTAVVIDNIKDGMKLVDRIHNDIHA